MLVAATQPWQTLDELLGVPHLQVIDQDADLDTLPDQSAIHSGLGPATRGLLRPLLSAIAAGAVPVPGPASMPPTLGTGTTIPIGGSPQSSAGCAPLIRRRRPPAGLDDEQKVLQHFP